MITDRKALLTKDGWKHPSELLNTDVSFVCPVHGTTVKGYVKEQGLQDVWKYNLVPRQNTSGFYSEELVCTRPQRVVFGERDAFTMDLREGDKVLASISDVGYNAGQWGNGFVYACGLSNSMMLDVYKYPDYRQKLKLFTQTNEFIGPPFIPYDGTAVEKASFIQGYLSGNGWPVKMQTVSSSLMDFFIENAGLAGIVITGQRYEHPITCFESHKVYINHQVTYSRGVQTKYFRVTHGPDKCDYPEMVYGVYLENGGVYTMNGGWTLGSD